MRPAFFLALSALSAFAPAADVVGYLGQAKTAMLLYGAPSPKARARMRVAQGTSLIVRPAGKKWYGVFLIDGRMAYAPVQTVDVPTDPATGQPHGFTNAQVAATRAQVRRSTYVASRGNFVRGSGDARTQMAVEAMRLEGTTPYVWGGNELGSGIDCSGFVKKMYGAIGYSLPRTAAEQATVGMPITRLEELQPGDRLYFYDARKGKIGHTGLYVGGGYFTHSSSGHHGIARDYLTERWRHILVAARR